MNTPPPRVHVDGWGPLYLSHMGSTAVRSLSDGAFRVWATLCAHAGCRSTRVVIGVDRLAHLCGHSHRSIQRHLATLEEAGLVSRESRFGKRGQQLRAVYELLEPVRGGETALSPLKDDPIQTETIPTDPPSVPPSRGEASSRSEHLALLPDPLVAMFEKVLLDAHPDALNALETGEPMPEKLGDLIWLVLEDPIDPALLDWAIALAKGCSFSGRKRSTRAGLIEAAVNVRAMFWGDRTLQQLQESTP